MASKQVRPAHMMAELLVVSGVIGAALVVASSVADACVTCGRWLIG